jgi:ubiquinone/menaquinone biosynthesis C-methylase UbiE
MDYYTDLYDKVGKRIGWDFSQVKKVEIGKAWDFYQKVIDKVQPGDTLLDIGTGGGEKILKIAEKVDFIYGVDHSESMIKTAKKNLRKSGLNNVKFLLMESSKLKFTDEYFDIVTDRHCDFNSKEVYRVLKRNGYFLTQQVGEGDQLNIKKAFKRGQSYGVKDGTLMKRYLKELKEVGFRNIKSYEYNSEVFFKTDNDYLFVLRFTPTIPCFGDYDKDLKIFKNFVKNNKTNKGIKTNSKRFMIVAQK